MNDEDFDLAMDTQWAIGWADIAALRRGVPCADHEDYEVKQNVEILPVAILKYATEEERLEARRRTWRESSRRYREKAAA